MADDVRSVAFKHAVKNALEYGKAQPGNLVGKVIGEVPSAKSDMKATMAAINEAVNQANALRPSELETLVGTFEYKEAEKGRQSDELAVFPFLKKGLVVRMAPNPNFVLHIGHAKPTILNDEYAKLYEGRFILRLEDTDPKTKRPMPEAYTLIPDDVRWLGCTVKDEDVFVQSARMDLYYDYAKRLIEKGGAYVDDTPAEQMSEERTAAKKPKARDLSVHENLNRWDRMTNAARADKYVEGGAVLRVKTDYQHPNSSIRDWPAFRIIEGDHPKTGTKYRCWPLYNFSAAIDDALMGVTMVIRGKDHELNAQKQKYIFDYFEWTQPDTIECGMLGIADLPSHKSEIVAGIASGKFKGYDDIQLPTLRALRRRGIQPAAIRRYVIAGGVKPVDSTLDWQLLFKFNREILHPVAPHYWFIPNPVPVKFETLDAAVPAIPKSVHVRLHPTDERGHRTLPVDPARFFLSKEDVQAATGAPVRFRELGNFTLTDAGVATPFHHDVPKDAPKLNWVSGLTVLGAVIKRADGGELVGFCEPDCANLNVGDIVQFERVEYCRLDEIHKDASGKPNKLVFWQTH